MPSEMFIPPKDLAAWPELPEVFVRAAQSPTVPSVGVFLMTLTEEQIDVVLGYAQQARQGGQALMGLNLFTVMLANAEGMPVNMEDNLSVLSRRLILMLQAQMLHLQGILVLDHNRLTLEHFDVRDVPLSPSAKERFGGVRVVRTPPQVSLPSGDTGSSASP